MIPAAMVRPESRIMKRPSCAKELYNSTHSGRCSVTSTTAFVFSGSSLGRFLITVALLRSVIATSLERKPASLTFCTWTMTCMPWVIGCASGEKVMICAVNFFTTDTGDSGSQSTEPGPSTAGSRPCRPSSTLSPATATVTLSWLDITVFTVHSSHAGSTSRLSFTATRPASILPPTATTPMLRPL
eukprot:Mycagemm_TRINITY_DN10169_c1_g2::TRINITY_DN10169_c1_g2_i1::g.5235::m.5235 type:complete len:186 gc:universal TRINITY_DN10169_c1_g2_i1:858-301(-)